jgi:hypothetical protein
MTDKKIITKTGQRIAVIRSTETVITDGQSALDFITSVGYENDCHKIALNKEAVTEDFFKLSTGLAGEIAQKFVNYHYSLAIIGNFSHYTSQALRDYIYETNKGRHLFFVKDEMEAVEFLSK